jgi:hypothetical protein
VAIAAIETRYAGCRFRSRLEARYAVLFDHLGIRWEYEPEGFETSAGRYLPDFRIELASDPAHPVWFEVKPDHFRHDTRHRALVEGTGQPLLIAAGMPRDYLDQMRGARSPLRALLPGQITDPIPAALVGAGWYMGELWNSIHKGRHWVLDAHDSVHIGLYAAGLPLPFFSWDVDAAYTAARSARFEHGERG